MARFLQPAQYPILDGTEAPAEVERWFRQQGLPYLVRPRRFAHNLIRRTSPFFVYVLVFNILALISENVPYGGSFAMSDEAEWQWYHWLDYLGILALPAVVSVLYSRFTVANVRIRRWVGWITFIGYVLLEPLIEWASQGAEFNFLDEIQGTLLLVVLALIVTASGLGSLVAFAMSASVRQIGSTSRMTTVALPIFLALMLFSFFSKELWEIGNTMYGIRLEMTIILLLSCAVAMIYASSSREFAASGTKERSGSGWWQLHWYQRFNVLSSLAVSQLMQAMYFLLLVFLFLLVLGSVAIDPELLSAWIGEVPIGVEFGFIVLPLSQPLIGTAALFGGFAALYYVVSMMTDQSYRENFYLPLIAQLQQALVIHENYLARIHRHDIPVRAQSPAADLATEKKPADPDAATGSSPQLPQQ